MGSDQWRGRQPLRVKAFLSTLCWWFGTKGETWFLCSSWKKVFVQVKDYEQLLLYSCQDSLDLHYILVARQLLPYFKHNSKLKHLIDGNTGNGGNSISWATKLGSYDKRSIKTNIICPWLIREIVGEPMGIWWFYWSAFGWLPGSSPTYGRKVVVLDCCPLSHDLCPVGSKHIEWMSARIRQWDLVDGGVVTIVRHQNGSSAASTSEVCFEI